MHLQPLTAAEVHARSAGLSPQIRSGLFVPGDHWVDNERLMRALLIACQRAGVRLEAGHAVQEFHTQGDHIESVMAGNGASFTAKTYVLAAGCWSGEIAGGLGIHVPITPCCGQMMEFEAPRELPFVVRAGIHYLVPRPERRVAGGNDRGIHRLRKGSDGERAALHSRRRGAPGAAGERAAASCARGQACGPTPRTTCRFWVMEKLNNLVFATGHFRNGILLAPVTAEIIADLIMKGSTSRPT